jgi:hypothetical protein
MSSNTADSVDYSSPITGISLTLPKNWQQSKVEETDEPTDIYFLPSDYDYDPQIIIKVFEIPEAENHPDNYQEFAVALLEMQCKNDTLNLLEVLEQKLVTIDNSPARIDVFNYVDSELEVPITQYQVCIQQDAAVCGFLAMVETAYLSEYLPILEAAVQSMRFHL